MQTPIHFTDTQARDLGNLGLSSEQIARLSEQTLPICKKLVESREFARNEEREPLKDLIKEIDKLRKTMRRMQQFVTDIESPVGNAHRRIALEYALWEEDVEGVTHSPWNAVTFGQTKNPTFFGLGPPLDQLREYAALALDNVPARQSRHRTNPLPVQLIHQAIARSGDPVEVSSSPNKPFVKILDICYAAMGHAVPALSRLPYLNKQQV